MLLLPLLVTQLPLKGLSGFAVDSSGTAFGSVVGGGAGLGQGGDPSELVIIDACNGNLISTVGIITDTAGTQISIGDLTVQPGTDILFGIGSLSAGPFGGIFYTIDTTNAQATQFGSTGFGVSGGLGFAPDGTLYATTLGALLTIDPTNGNLLTLTSLSFNPEIDGLGVRSDGTIFATGGAPKFNTPFTVTTIVPNSGLVTTIGITQVKLSDLDFIECQIVSPVGGEMIPLDTTMVLVSGSQYTAAWMIPVIVSVIGFAIVIARKF